MKTYKTFHNAQVAGDNLLTKIGGAESHRRGYVIQAIGEREFSLLFVLDTSEFHNALTIADKGHRVIQGGLSCADMTSAVKTFSFKFARAA